MITISQFVATLKTKYTDTKFFNGCISKEEKCVGVFARGNVPKDVGIGSPLSYGILPVTLLVHWGENSNDCEEKANAIYEGLEQGIPSINGKRVIQIQLLESAPVDIGRDDNNICERTIRLNIFYERR